MIEDKNKTTSETFKVQGEELLRKVKEIIKEGNAKSITIKNKTGNKLIVIPLTMGVVGMAFLPVYAALGAIAALVTECTVTVENYTDKKKKDWEMGIAKVKKNQKENKPSPKTEDDAKLIGIKLPKKAKSKKKNKE